jgi:hypothetical protein
MKLGKPTDKKFLTGIIPDHWKEKIYEDEKHWSCEVKGERLEEKDWQRLVSKMKRELGSTNILEIYSKTSNGVHFVVYLRKAKEL